MTNAQRDGVCGVCKEVYPAGTEIVPHPNTRGVWDHAFHTAGQLKPNTDPTSRVAKGTGAGPVPIKLIDATEWGAENLNNGLHIVMKAYNVTLQEIKQSEALMDAVTEQSRQSNSIRMSQKIRGFKVKNLQEVGR